MEETFKQEFSEPQNRELREHSLVATLRAIDNKTRGWGNQYSFCNEGSIWGAIDEEINELLRSYLGSYSDIRNKLDKKSKRRLLGIHLISESKKDQIHWPDTQEGD